MHIAVSGLALFDLYGSNLRIIVDILNKPSLEAACLNHVQAAAAKVIREFSTTFQELLELDFSSTYAQTQGFGLTTTCVDPYQLHFLSRLLPWLCAVAQKLNNMWSSQCSTPIPVFAVPPGGCSKIWARCGSNSNRPDLKYITRLKKSTSCLLLRR